jgi:hypothetical protein
MRMHGGRAILEDRIVSFDIYLVPFAAGEPAEADTSAVLHVLAPFVTGVPDDGFVKFSTADGGADLYGLGSDSLMVNHASGESIWQVLVDVAEAVGYTIMPVGSPVCIVHENMRAELPEEFRVEAVVVTSGKDVRDVVRAA